MTTATVLAQPLPELLAQSSRRRIRIFGQQQHRLRSFRGIDIRLVDTRIGDHEAELVLDDQDAGTMPQHPPRLAENDLDQARIFLDLFRQRQCAARPGLTVARST